MRSPYPHLYAWLCGAFLLSACMQGESSAVPQQAATVPVSGYEHTIRFDVAGVHLDVPYGYLYEYPNTVKQAWLRNADKRYATEPLRLMVAERETLAPYNQETQHHFKNYFQGTGSDVVSILIYGKAECDKLNQQNAMNNLIALGYTKILDLPSGYLGYEKKLNSFTINQFTIKTNLNV